MNKEYINKSSFKAIYPFHERIQESERVLRKYKDRKPIICERGINATVPPITKKKYLVPDELTMGQFVYVIRRRLTLDPGQAIFLFINGTIPSSSTLMIELYEKYKNEDGFLYITYNGENVFGKNVS